MDSQDYCIKIKTIDNQSYEFKVTSKMIVADLKKLIEKALIIPLMRQRLIFKGKMLNNADSLAMNKIEDGNVLHLVGNALNSVEENGSPSIGGQSATSLDDADIGTGFVRSLNETQEHRRQTRRKVLQQRLQGFPHLPSRPCPALYQNLLTITQLMKSLSSIIEVQEYGQVFNQLREFDVGMWIDAKDANHEWQEAQVVQKHANHILIHYNSLGSRLQEEWFHISSPRIATFRSHTVQHVNNIFMSPIPSTQPILQGPGCQSLGELLASTALLMIRVGNMMGRLADEHNHSNHSQKSQSEMQNLINGMIEEQRRNQDKDDKMDSKSFQQENDANSLKSLKSIKSEKISVDYETSSMKSMKSDISKLTYIQNSNVSHNLQENITEEEEDSQEDVTSDNEQIANNISKDSKETTTTTGKEWDATLIAAQLAPIADRLGRLLIDLAPYMAMKGSQIQNITQNSHINNISNLSIITNEDSQISGALNAQNYYFQVPVMLTPQEVYSQPQTSVQRAVGDNVDIHIHTYLPQQQNSYIPQQSSQTPQQSSFTPQHQTNRQQPKSKDETIKVMPRSSLLANSEQSLKKSNTVKLQVDQQEKKERKKKNKEVSFSEQIFQLKKQKSHDKDELQ